MTSAIDRELTIELLRCMSVELPPKTKLPDAELDKRLSKTLDGCQDLTRVLPSITLNPAAYKSWRLDKTNRPVFDAVRRTNIGESSFVYDKQKEGNYNPYPLYVDPFMDLWQSIMSIGKKWDEERTTVFLADKEQTSCIFIRVVDVLEFDKQTPVFIVLFRRELRGIQPSESMVDWLLLQGEYGKAGKGVFQIFATAKERAPPFLERDFVPSFILPVGPLGVKDVAKFNSNDGCSMCGEPAKSKCSRCNVKRYCGAVCQREDWKTHRPTCTSFKGATWQTVPFVPSGHRVSRYDPVEHYNMAGHEEAEVDSNAPPPNTHGSTTFIVKVQLNSSEIHTFLDVPGKKIPPSGISMLIYDRRRSFQATLLKFVCPAAAFDPVAERVKTKGRRGLKLFCWATRTGDWSLDLCVDQFPDWQQ
ncbi:hypothetical protein FB451DRAFT_1465131 [Mycena latifolia]|nr:hypothetical protein FB451DRAFT_1465131 [Mycena latifolia]